MQLPYELRAQPEVNLLANSCTSQCHHYYTLENPLHLGALELNSFNHDWTYQISYTFPNALGLLVLTKFLADHVTGHFRLLSIVAPWWMDAPCLPTILTMLEDIPDWCPFIKDLIKDVLVG